MVGNSPILREYTVHFRSNYRKGLDMQSVSCTSYMTTTMENL
jgi:hypothetical protein